MAAIYDFFVGLYSLWGSLGLIGFLLVIGTWLVITIAQIGALAQYDPQCGD